MGPWYQEKLVWEEKLTNLQSNEESSVGIWVADANVAEGVEDGVVGEDVVCGYEGGEEGCCVLHLVFIQHNMGCESVLAR